MRALADISPQLLRVHAIGAGIVVAALAAGWFLFVRPSDTAREARERTNAALRDAEPRLETLRRERVQVEAAIVEASQRLESNNQRLRGIDAQNERIAELTALAGECGLQIDRLLPGERARQGLYLVVPIRLEGAGEYPDCARFLHLVVDRFSDMSVRSFRLRADQGGRNRRALFGFDLAWYADPAGAAGDSSSEAVAD